MEKLEEVKKILDHDEEIGLSYRPNKRRFILINSIAGTFFLLIFLAIMLAIGISNYNTYAREVAEGKSPDFMTTLICFIIAGVILLITIFNVANNIMRYRNTIYIVTNKRIIVRSGFIGADYQSVALKSIQALSVRVDFLDKLIRPTTGSIFFGSTAAPVIDQSGKGQSGFAFAHIEDPYGAYQQIKDYTDAHK